MATKFLAALAICRTKLAIALCGLGLCCPCFAEFWSDQNKPYYRDNSRLEVLPIRLMDNETLFKSAQQQRDGRMCDHKRLLNSQWLLQNDRNTWSGGSAVGKVFRTGFNRFWSAHKGSKKGSVQSYFFDQDMTYLGNYAFGASEDKVYVGVKFDF
ncbi:hypothetical protein SAMN02745866_00663 [Alteromonadaceae bacterium Bs31]|nr:hypothetical protein SAMN02745866_00663 [Alteromonadaceae bacterium Bs31]